MIGLNRPVKGIKGWVNVEGTGAKMDREKTEELIELADWLDEKDPVQIKAVIGFDGFVDDVVHVVEKRIDPQNYIRVPTLKRYGERIAATSGLSSNVEIVTISRKVGGNGAILANALIEFGIRMSYIGAIGYPEINPVFQDMADRCERVYPVSNPSSTDAMEFEDGKIIRSKLSPFLELTYENVKERVGIKELARLLDECELIGFEDWSLTQYSEQIWKGMYDEVLPLLKKDTSGKTLFFDIADPASRKKDEFRSVLGTISRFSSRYNVILGLNLSEAVQTANLFGGNFSCSDYDLREVAKFIKRYVNVETLVIHPLKEACSISGNSFIQRNGPYCAKPSLTTGAGDNFNAGFLLGVSLGAVPEWSLLLGMAASGFYVRNSRSGNFDEIKSFLKLWARGEID